MQPSVRVTGLTPSTSYTYKWAHRVDTTSGGGIGYGGTTLEFSGVKYGPATMEVYAA